jgi:hypothetical protein
MDRSQDYALNVSAAKERLRRTAAEASPVNYLRRNPYLLVAVTVAAGFLLGRKRLARNLLSLAALKSLWSLGQSAMFAQTLMKESAPLRRRRPPAPE